MPGIEGPVEDHPEEARADVPHIHREFCSVGQRKGAHGTEGLPVIGNVELTFARSIPRPPGDDHAVHDDLFLEAELQPFGSPRCRALTGLRAGGNPIGHGAPIQRFFWRMIRLPGTGRDVGQQIRRRRSGLRPVRHDKQIAIEPVPRRRSWQREGNVRRAGHAGFGPGQFLGGVLGGDNRSTKIPAALDVEAHFQTQTIGFTQRVSVKRAPLGGEECRAVFGADIAILAGAIGVADQRAAETLRLHLLQVTGDRVGRDVAVQPPPIGAETGAARRVLPTCAQGVAGNFGGGQLQACRQQQHRNGEALGKQCWPARGTLTSGFGCHAVGRIGLEVGTLGCIRRMSSLGLGEDHPVKDTGRDHIKREAHPIGHG